MATFKVINGQGKYQDETATEDLIAYILDPRKTRYSAGFAVSLESPAESMELVSELYGKQAGVRLRHYVISFAPGDHMTPEHAYEIAKQIASFIARNYQIVFAVHEDTAILHMHFVFNSISYQNGHRNTGKHEDFFRELNMMRAILRSYGVKTLTYIPKEQTYQ